MIQIRWQTILLVSRKVLVVLSTCRKLGISMFVCAAVLTRAEHNAKMRVRICGNRVNQSTQTPCNLEFQYIRFLNI